jgi:2-haloacid dehalogenase
MTERWASFDCYGTLIDWNGGMTATFEELWPELDAEELLERYHEIEPRVQLQPGLPYRDVLIESLRLMAEHEGLGLDPRDATALADSLPKWQPFPEVPPSLDELRARGWKLAILSNTDPDLLDASLARIGIPVEATVTAADAGAYKPALAHWETFFQRRDVDRTRHVHVAASAFHDVAPCAQLGVPAVWINRLREASDLPRAAELPDLNGVADVLDRLVPATF